jgi:hypothetical protein
MSTSRSDHRSERNDEQVGTRHWIAVAATGLALAAAALSTTAAGFRPTGHTSATQNVKDEAHLHLTGTNGSLLIEEGQATGQIPGKVKASFEIEASVTSNFWIYTRDGSISGQGKGTLHSTGPNSSFGGSLKITGGSGRYKHAHGSGGFYGLLNRKTYAVTVQTSGKLTY